MNINIKQVEPGEEPFWDEFVYKHSNASLYHLFRWQKVVREAYYHKAYYLMASENTGPLQTDSVIGILPLVHLKHFLFGNSLISIPFFDLGGIVALDLEVEKNLLFETLRLAKKLGVRSVELRAIKKISWLEPPENALPSFGKELPDFPFSVKTKSHKVRMVLDLPESSGALFNSFKSKLRSQIRVPLKEGLKSKIGGLDLLDDFYEVFLINMRDLGSPVHSKKLLQKVLEEFSDSGKIVMVYKGGNPLAGSIIIGFKDILENPWASSLKQYSRMSPNMLLYWTMLEYACDNGYQHFDFGRSSPNEGTYKFKEQWGAKPTPLNWHYLYLNNRPDGDRFTDKTQFDLIARLWQKLPVAVTKVVGPRLRKYIGL